MPRYLISHCFWVCLWRCFQERLAFELESWVKQITSPVREHHSSWWHPGWNRKTKGVWIPSSPNCWAGISTFSCPWNSCFSGLQSQAGIYTISSQAFQSLPWLSWLSSMSVSASITPSVNPYNKSSTHGVTRVGYNLVTKQQSLHISV